MQITITLTDEQAQALRPIAARGAQGLDIGPAAENESGVALMDLFGQINDQLTPKQEAS